MYYSEEIQIKVSTENYNNSIDFMRKSEFLSFFLPYFFDFQTIFNTFEDTATFASLKILDNDILKLEVFYSLFGFFVILLTIIIFV